MAITRFDKFTPRDYNMEWYAPKEFMPNFEAWSELLSTQQSKYDQAILASQKLPKHLQHRTDLAGEYKQKVTSGIDDISKTYMEKGLTEGNRKMRDFGLAYSQDWQPGGLAYELEQEYTDYANAQAQIDKYYKDNKAEHSVNRRFSLDALDKAAKQEFKFNPETNMYQRANISADLRPYVDIMEEAQKVVKDIKENGRTDIIQMSPAWFMKVKTEEVTPQTIREVTEALMQQPKYAEQRQLELWGEKQKYTPEQLVELENKAKENLKTNLDNVISEAEKLKSTKEGKEALQTMLQKQGYYTGKINGEFGKESKEAYEQFLQDSKNKVANKISSVNADDILNEKILSNYTDPLVKAYARQKIDKDLTFNKEWEVNRKIASQREQTNALVTAIQSLNSPAQSEVLVSPGLSRPMETLDDLRKNYNNTYESSKKAFRDIASISGITGILGTGASNVIHTATEIRLRSKTPEEFENNLRTVGIVTDSDQLWDFYNSPASEGLKNSYLSMQQAKHDIVISEQAQSDVYQKYFQTEEGKKDLATLRKNYNLKNETPEQIASLLINNDKRFTTVQLDAGLLPVGKVNVSNKIKDNINNAMKNNPDIFPQSLRGYALTAKEGALGDLNKLIVQDLKTGYTLGYTSDTGDGMRFNTVNNGGKGSEVAFDNINLENMDIRFNVDPKGVTYYLTSKEKGEKGNYVSSVVRAPESHTPKLIQTALELKKQAEETKDNNLRDQAELMYSVLTKGPQYDHAVQDQYQVTPYNGRQLYDVIDPNASTKVNIKTFKENAYIKGTPIGNEIESDNMLYQKFKVLDNTTGQQKYMMTVRTDKGYMPIMNDNGSYWYNSSQAAEHPIVHREMMSQIPVNVKQQNVKQTNVTEQQAGLLMLGSLNNN